MDIKDIVILTIICTAWAAVSLFLTVLFHEAGHLIAGKLSGYRLSGFALMGLMFRGGKPERYDRRSLNAGQCFMYTDDEGKDPRLLILGGCMMNILLSAVLTAAAFVMADFGEFGTGDLYVLILFLIPSVMGMAMGVSNLFLGSATSDGNTFRECGDEEHRREYNRIMRITGYLIDGLPFSGMPDGLFSYGKDWRECSLSAEMRMYCYWRGFEMTDTRDGLATLAKGYGFDGESWKKGRFFPEENSTEREIYRVAVLGGKPESEPSGDGPREELLMRLAGRRTGSGGPGGVPFGGLMRSYELCLGNGTRIIGKGGRRG